MRIAEGKIIGAKNLLREENEVVVWAMRHACRG